MNKKVSTLVAALMAAGALVLPKDVFAQIQYSETAKDYKSVTALTDTEVKAGGKFAIVFQAENADGQMVDYVAVVKNEGNVNKLVAKTFEEATINDFVNVSFSASKYSITDQNNQNKLVLNQQSSDWSAPTAGGIKTDFTVLKNQNGKVVIATDANSISLINNEGEVSFAPYAKASKSGFTGKIVSLSSLEKQSIEQVYACKKDESILGEPVILAYGNKVLAWDKTTNKAVLVDYNVDEPYTWTLVQSETDPAIAYFVNEDGQYLVQDKKIGVDKRDYAVTVRLKKDSEGNYILYSGSWDNITITNVSAAPSGKIMVANVPAKDFITSDKLNDWYNGKGLNFTAGKDVEGNLFGGEKVVFSYTVRQEYELVGLQGDHKAVIPVGTYFFTDVKFLNGKGAADSKYDPYFAKNIDWLNSTLIAVSSTETNESTDLDRAFGDGFELVAKLGKDFDYQANEEKPQGADLAIENAAFFVHQNSDNVFALQLNTFWYQAKGSNYDKEDQKKAENIKLAVEGYTTDSSRKVVVSKSTSKDQYVFSYTNSAAINTRTLLNETKEAAVYTIQFVKGVDEDKDLMNKYLTMGVSVDQYYNTAERSFRYEAKPNAIFEKTHPIFQWVITNVGDEDVVEKEHVYKTVTFTNRETGESFTTSLFKEGEYYSMTVNDINVVPFTVKEGTAQNTYDVTAQDKVKIDSNILVKLEKVTDVDEHAGFLNVEDGSIRTMAFARDKYTTSNRLFAAVVENDGYKYLNDDDKFATEVSEAAQWKLMKIEEKEISRSFVYNKTATASADRVNDGDKVKAYVYALRYVEDGSETDYFLRNSYYDFRGLSYYEDVESSEDLKDDKFSDVKFLVKENVDGSISLIRYISGRNDYFATMQNSKVAESDQAKSLDVEYVSNKTYKYTFNYGNDREYVYKSNVKANDIKLYLDPEHKEISWPAEEGHVTLLSERLNYITMDGNEAIEVSENSGDKFYLSVTDKNAVVPSFYLSLGKSENSNIKSERMFMFNSVDSVNYQLAEGAYDTKYEVAPGKPKLLFKAATLNATSDTLSINVKGETKYIAEKADDNNKNIWGGLKRFKFQIVETEDGDGYYYIRQLKADKYQSTTKYLGSVNSSMTLVPKTDAMKFRIEEVEAPTSNEGVSTTEVKVVANNGSINVKNAAGKNVVVSTILGQVVANEVLTSDNATINVPAGIVVVAVEGESFKVNVK